MMSLQEKYSDDFLRQKIKKWLKIKESDEIESYPIIFARSERPFGSYFPFGFFSKEIPEEEEGLRRRVKLLEGRCKIFERKIRKLEQLQGIRRKPTKSELIYSKYKDKLKKEHFGKIVAIDNDSEEIVGIGDTILEAYKEARKKSFKDKFSYHKVGFDYVHRI